eukprot:789996-Pyramimonas_sp.AAC.1
MGKASWSIRGPGMFTKRSGAPSVLTEIPYVQVSNYLFKDLGTELVAEIMQKCLSSSEHPRAQDILEGGLWTDPPR